MLCTLLYLGPGLGIGTIFLVIIILLIVVFSFGMIIWTPIKNLIRKIRGKNN
ncbi:MAG: hypothetical protein ABJF11_09775 [Reichenbachiella sp.]|uniref:hypothetical protein n=1 Tax=Reichenbachiella sp. TaxID=2184521 RepID=UPI003266788E